MLALLRSEAKHRGLKSCVLTFEPHPRDYFAHHLNKPELAPARIANLRDKLEELDRCGVQQCVVLRFDAQLAQLSAMDFIQEVLLKGLKTRYLLVGDDFRFGAQRMGDYALLADKGPALGFDVARMNSYEISSHENPSLDQQQRSPSSVRVSSSAVRQSLSKGLMSETHKLLGRPYSISGHVVHGRHLGRSLQARTLNLRFRHNKAATQGIFIALVHGLGSKPLPSVANFGVRPSLSANDVNAGRVLLETHVLSWPEELGTEGGYGKIIRVELLEKLHDELTYASLSALEEGIQNDCATARAWFKTHESVLHAS
jgi:riboflavin kinase/FMN adenylyltransferase